MSRARVGEYEALLEAIGRRTRLRPEGDHHKGRCPFHDDSTPSLCVYPCNREGGLDAHYWCFGCGARGDLIDWLRREEGLAFGAAKARVGALTLDAGERASRLPPEGPGGAGGSVGRSGRSGC